ncbi:Phage/plasmid primase P4-like protein [Methanospirillum hungatei JF-1]|uniref:Phage/plasmid primase P4-like protein n=1 Tax=Methanospirillum hungatei JF-1 (strain ATCC 27890 / DSM 864 / NBRC 100397 / JF-1) TaxID=323259 RepID=Q2FPK6_METHJ|nr:phage/plasmid primase, P4 family [Methanospirillum hungatei]ABD40750.1 Phage/plasmid primase P4-like protein [Methanospirillum hungatei JF-1]
MTEAVSVQNHSEEETCIPPEIMALGDNIRVIPVKPGIKKPIGDKWQNENNHPLDYRGIHYWFKNGNNYGIIPQGDLVILDADEPEKLGEVIDYIGDSLTVRTPSGGYHIYFYCAELGTKKIILYEFEENHDGKRKKGLHLAEIYMAGCRGFVVGAGSRTDKGVYRVVNASAPRRLPDPGDFKRIIRPFRDDIKYDDGSHKQNQKERDSIPKLYKNEVYQDGERNNALISLAGRLVGTGITDESELFRMLSDANNNRCIPTLDEADVQRIARSALRYEPNQRRPLTDLGNGERFFDMHGETTKFIPAWQKWFIWDGHLWREDRKQEIRKLANKTVRSLYVEASKIEEDDLRKKLVSWARASESASKIQALLTSAAALVADVPESFDNKPDLFNLKNGTYNLHSHEFRDHLQADMLTKCGNFSYEPNASCPVWEKHIQTIFLNDQSLIGSFQELCGYSFLSGNPDEIFVICHGSGRNGKGKTLDLLKHLHGDYAKTADFKTFLTPSYTNSGSNPSPDLARLYRSRLVIASETGNGSVLDESIIKRLSGNDTISARFLRQEIFEYTPEFVIFLQMNPIPRFNDWDKAIENRLWLVPFNHYFEPKDRDPDILDKFKAESAGIFCWCMEGLKRYQALGRLTRAAAIETACESVRKENDSISCFIEDCCTLSGKISRKDLYNHYAVWCGGVDMCPEVPRKFTSALLKKHGVKDGVKSNGVRYLQGISIQ